MRPTFIQFTAVALILAWIMACAPLDRMVAARRDAEVSAQGQPLPILDLPVDYDDADLVRFVDDNRLLIGSADVDNYSTPVFGPLILYDLKKRRELWRVDRKHTPGASFDIIAVSPQVVLRTTLGGDTLYQGFDLTTGAERWSRESDSQCLSNFTVPAASDSAALLELCGEELTRISVIDGRHIWQSTTNAFDESVARQLRTAGDRIVIVDNAHITAFFSENGAEAWNKSQNVGQPFDALLDADGLVLYGPTKADGLALADGQTIWRWSTDKGAIRLMGAAKNRILAIVQSPDMRSDTLVVLADRATREIGSVALDGFLASPLVVHEDSVLMTVGTLSEQTFGMVDAPEKRLTFTRKRILVGVSLTNAKEIMRVELPTVGDPLTWSELSGPPDCLEIRGNRLLVVRADHGVTAVDLSSGVIAWARPHDRPSETYQESLFKLSVSQPAVAGPFHIGGSNSLVAAQPSRPLGVSQSFYAARSTEARRVLSDPYASADRRASARVDLDMAARSEMTMLQIGSTFAQTQAAADVAMGVLGVATAFQQAWQLEAQRGLAGLYHASLLDVQEATRRHGMAFSGRFYMEPGPLAVSLTDLDNGRRARLQLGPAVEGARARMRATDLSPSGKRLAAVAIGLDARNYIERRRFGLTLPASSILIYDLADLEFREEVPAVTAPSTAGVLKLNTGSAGALTMAGDYDGLYAALKKGANVDELYFGVTPLMFAVAAARVEFVSLLLSYGADINAKSASATTVYDELRNVRDENRRETIRRLLEATAGGRRPPKP